MCPSKPPLHTTSQPTLSSYPPYPPTFSTHHYSGEFHNPGWAIGDTPNLSIIERRKQAAIDQWSKKYIGLVAKYAW